MWLEAIITQEDLAKVLGEFLPVKIYLDQEGDKTNKDRWLMLNPATQVTLVPDEGMRVTCPAEFSWSVAGVSPTVKLDELRVLICPQVVEKNKGQVLEFDIKVEEADFHNLPGFVDSTIAKAVNSALASKKLSWNFTETLTRTVDIGKMFEPIEGLKIEVLWGKRRIANDALALVLSFHLSFVRGD